ncbi:hypothetical protein MXB_172, partial [Myxobolus squamalis]
NKLNFKGYLAHWQAYLRKADSSARTYIVDQIQSINLWSTLNNRHLNIGKNTTILFDFATFKIQEKHLRDQSKVQLAGENLERKLSNFAMAGWLTMHCFFSMGKNSVYINETY